MNVVVYQNTVLCKRLIDNINSYLKKDEGIICLGGTDSRTYLSVYDAFMLYKNQEVDRILLHSMIGRKEILKQVQNLCNIGFERKDIYIATIEFMHWSGNEKISFQEAFVNVDDFCYLDTLLIPMTEHCNLNCKGCSHFSPLVKEESFLDYESFCKDLIQIKKLIKHTHQINILGGEPLLHKELYKFVEYAREQFPYSIINIVTNGILIPQMPKELIYTVKKVNAVVLLSVYPVMTERVPLMIDFLKKRGIQFFLLEMSDFAPMLKSEKHQYPAETTEFICSNCNMLKDGKLVRCPMFLTVDYFNKYFGTKYPWEDAVIDIYDSELTSKKMLEKLNEVHELCRYCARYRMPYSGMKKWECYHVGEEKRQEDWLED